MMCGIPTSIWLILITIAILAAVVFKMRGLLKNLLPEPGPDNGFTVYLVICGVMLFASVSVMQTIGEHNEQIAAMFAEARKKCEPPKDERPWEQILEEDLQKLKDKQ